MFNFTYLFITYALPGHYLCNTYSIMFHFSVILKSDAKVLLFSNIRNTLSPTYHHLSR